MQQASFWPKSNIFKKSIRDSNTAKFYVFFFLVIVYITLNYRVFFCSKGDFLVILKKIHV